MWLARHGRKAAFCASTPDFQWKLRDANEVRHVAKELVTTVGAKPTRILSSPYHRAVQTACIYAAELGLPSICIEPALCEVLTPELECRTATVPGMPQWNMGALKAIASPFGVVVIDETYEAIVPFETLEMETEPSSRAAIQNRVETFYNAFFARHDGSGAFFATHERAAKILLRLLQGFDKDEVPEGCVIELARAQTGANWYAWRQTSLVECFARDALETKWLKARMVVVAAQEFAVDTICLPIPNQRLTTFVEKFDDWLS